MPDDQSPIPWNNLLWAAKTGDSSAKSLLFRELEVRLRLIVEYRLYASPKDHLDDIVQDCLVVLAEKFGEIERDPHRYALTILKNKSLHYLRARYQNRTEALDEGDCSIGSVSRHDARGGGLHEIVEASDSLEHVKQAIAKLSPLCRRIFLRILEGKPLSEVWAEIREEEPSLKRATFDKRVFDCRARLRSLVEEEQR
jgi:RNA polymerase sigma factor (sigma-70 family)